ncbi:hypothetical protein PHMEG_00019298 [Phytophthora megakarya]|uniref:Uncharacterized protein n=1 Tax=Phytophthora megakarya TaxID=4795 RepID=A0A225VRN6_9STRA|nr:hypothetical protein PHMEG_00019298 [Phytophthora megakarya]
MRQSGSDPGSPPIPSPPDSPQSTGSNRSSQSTISRHSRSHTSDQGRRLATLEAELRRSSLARDRLVRDRDHLDLQVRQLRSDIRDMEVFQHGQRDEITRLEAEISNLAHDADDDPEVLRTHVLQLRTERNDFDRHAISAREDLHHAEGDRFRQDASFGNCRSRFAVWRRRQVRSATALASYNRISTSLAHQQPDRGGRSPLGGSACLAQADRDRALANLALVRATLTQVTSHRDLAFTQIAQVTEDRDLADRGTALQLWDQAIAERDQVRMDLLSEAARVAQLDDDSRWLAWSLRDGRAGWRISSLPTTN